MRLTWLAVAAVSASFSVGCSTAPPASTQSEIRIEAVTGTWATGLVTAYARTPRQLPPAVFPPGPILQPGDDAPANPRGPACALCPTGMGVSQAKTGWELLGRPDPIDIASALGAPELASAISDRITDAEIALAETAVNDQAKANQIVGSLAADLDQLAGLL